MNAKLYLAATPIGNLGDISQRFIETAHRVDLILCEDTRQGLKLMHHFGCRTPLKAYHQHNQKKITGQIIGQLLEGQQIMLISDAGTPIIQDPGFELVKRCHQHAIKITTLPGPCSIIAALTLSGIDCRRFSFMGYLEFKQSDAFKQLTEAKRQHQAVVFFVTPHQLLKQLDWIASVFGQQQMISLVKEISKINETAIQLPIGQIIDWLREDDKRQKGEFVVVIDNNNATNLAPIEQPLSAGLNANDSDFYPDPLLDKIMRSLLAEMPLKQAVKHAANITAHKRQQIYRFYANQ